VSSSLSERGFYNIIIASHVKNASSPTVMLYAWGEITVERMQHGMELFKQDVAQIQAGELDLELVNLLADLGSEYHGDHNVSRDFYRRIPATDMPEPHRFKVPLQQKAAGMLYEDDMDMVLPHELWARLFHFYKDAFFQFVVPALDLVERFWNAVAGGVLWFCVYVCHLICLIR
jgi:hypothetical protein